MATQDVFAHQMPAEEDDPMIGIQFLELRGDKCFDLLANTKGAAIRGSCCAHAFRACQTHPKVHVESLYLKLREEIRYEVIE